MTRVTHFSMSRRVRRYNVVALALVLCAWLISVAMHLHVKDEHAGTADSSPCGYCLALSAGAAPAPEQRVPAVIATPVLVVSLDDAPVQSQTAPSFYLSRGPPAA
jgi:hypothetical protein